MYVGLSCSTRRPTRRPLILFRIFSCLVRSGPVILLCSSIVFVLCLQSNLHVYTVYGPFSNSSFNQSNRLSFLPSLRPFPPVYHIHCVFSTLFFRDLLPGLLIVLPFPRPYSCLSSYLARSVVYCAHLFLADATRPETRSRD